MKISEEEIRKITLAAIDELGEQATPELVKNVVNKTISGFGDNTEPLLEAESNSGRVILTAFGKDSPGIIAAITDALAKLKCNLEDISQKIMRDYFTLIMIVDTSESPKELNDILAEMKKVQEEKMIKIYMQHENIFKSMHRI